MKTPKYLAVGLIAAGLVIGGSTAAHATTDSPYVTVAWSYPAYPDVTAPQPYIASVPGANLAALNSLAASPEWCGKPIQVDVYQRTDKHGISWEVLKETGSLLYGHDGGILAYNAGVGTPYRVITPEEYPCTTPTETPTTPATPTPTPTPTETPAPTSEPSTPRPTPSPTMEPTGTPSPSSPSSSEPPTTSPTPSVPVTVPTTPTETPTPSAPGGGTATSTPTSTTPDARQASSTASAVPVAADTSAPDELAYTGSNPWPGIAAALALVLSGLALLVAKRLRRS